MRILDLQVVDKSGTSNLEFPISRVYNLGFTMRDHKKMQAHLDEVGREGVHVPFRDNPPHIMPISPWATLTEGEITVQSGKTSGEVEIVTLARGDEVYVGVGSDHTDRSLEAINIPWSKQVAPDVMAPVVWRWEEVSPQWDEVLLECYITEEGREKLYQRAGVAEFWTPIEMRDSLRGRIRPVTSGFVVLFSGTVVTAEGKLSYARDWRISMIDPVLDRRIDHAYRVVVLNEEVLVP
jgi:hypothetical protein